MVRIEHRRFAREHKVVSGTAATHVIKIGFNAGQGEKISPGKLNGFLIYHDKLDNQNRLMIDYDAMARLGFSADSIQQALQGGFKADPMLLPQELRFVIMSDAKLIAAGRWEYPGLVDESYECYSKTGLFCFGNGEAAHRKDKSGARIRITCNPIGKSEVEPNDFCPYSVDKSCKLHYRLVIMLYTIGQDGKNVLVSPALGAQARFRLDSTSEYASADIFQQLDAAAGRVKGRLNGITGVLLFQKKGRRTGSENFSKSIVGHVAFKLDEESIRRREMQIAAEDEEFFNRQLIVGRDRLSIEPPRPSTATGPLDVRSEIHSAPAAQAAPLRTEKHQPAEHIQEQEQGGYDPPFESEEPDESNQSQYSAPPLSVADATDDELIEALSICQHRMANDDGIDPKIALLRLTRMDDFEGVAIKGINQVSYFIEAKGENDLKRRRLLRAICLKLESEKHPRFSPERLAVGGSAQK